MSYIKVKDSNGLVRDSNSGAILNSNVAGYLDHVKRNSEILAEKLRLKNAEGEINTLKDELKTIKELLIKLVEHNDISR